jgi:hypothetical protein
MGLHYSDDYLIVQGKQLSEAGLSVGASFPILAP